jgi:hypothetical protein
VKKIIFSKYIFNFLSLPSCHKHRPVFFRKFLQELAGVLLNDQQWEELTKVWYEVRNWYRVSNQLDSLLLWEDEAINRFAPAPGKILVFAAGNGREMRALQKIGYFVYGMELQSKCIHNMQSACNSQLLLGTATGSFSDIAHGRVSFPNIDFDGIIIGWGSITHVSSWSVASKFFKALGERYPEKLVLISWNRTTSKSKLIRFYRTIRNRISNQCGYFHQGVHSRLGPVSYLSYNAMTRLLKSVNFEVLSKGKDIDFPHLIVRSKPCNCSGERTA